MRFVTPSVSWAKLATDALGQGIRIGAFTDERDRTVNLLLATYTQYLPVRTSERLHVSRRAHVRRVCAGQQGLTGPIGLVTCPLVSPRVGWPGLHATMPLATFVATSSGSRSSHARRRRRRLRSATAETRADRLGLVPGTRVDVTPYGDGLHIAPGGRTARLVKKSGKLVAVSDTVVNDDDVFALIDVGRR